MLYALKTLKRATKQITTTYLSSRRTASAAINIICFGDSITEGAEFPPADRWPRVLQRKLNAWRPKYCQVYNCGRGGHTSSQGFDRFPRHILPHLPGLLLIQFGFNDANVPFWTSLPRVSLEEYRRNLRAFHRAALAYQSQCLFIVNHPIGLYDRSQGNGQSYKRNFAPYNRAVQEIAAELAAPAIDLPQIIHRRGIPLASFLAEDGLHLSRAGNHLYADIVFTAILPLLTAKNQVLNHSPAAVYGGQNQSGSVPQAPLSKQR